MKPAPFEYHRPTSLAETFDLLDRYGDDGRILAGGQSLVPALNMRLATPRAVIDINRLPGLDTIRLDSRGARRSARSRGRRRWSAPPLRARARAAARGGDRARGARGDPGARHRRRQPRARRSRRRAARVRGGARGDASRSPAVAGGAAIAAVEFFRGVYTTALEPGEVVTALRGAARRVPAGAAGFDELARRHGDFALAGLAARVRVERDAVGEARLVFFGVGTRPVRARAAEAALVGRRADADALAAAGRRAGPRSRSARRRPRLARPAPPSGPRAARPRVVGPARRRPGPEHRPDRQRRAGGPGGRAPAEPGGLPPPRARADRLARRLRARGVRRLHGPRGRQADPRLPDARGPGRRLPGRDHRGSRRERRHRRRYSRRSAPRTRSSAASARRACCSPRRRSSSASPIRTPPTIREALGGNYCRCTGYHAIVQAVLRAADRRGGAPAAPAVLAGGRRLHRPLGGAAADRAARRRARHLHRRRGGAAAPARGLRPLAPRPRAHRGHRHRGGGGAARAWSRW